MRNNSKYEYFTLFTYKSKQKTFCLLTESAPISVSFFVKTISIINYYSSVTKMKNCCHKYVFLLEC